MALSLGCAWTAGARAAVPGPQVVVEGSRHAGDRVRVAGHAVPLLRALEQIVPPSYSVNVPNAGTWADIRVSWRGDQSFVDALGEILSGNRSLQARVNTDLHLVTVSAVAPLPTRPASPVGQYAMQPVAPMATPPLMDASSVMHTAAPAAAPAIIPASYAVAAKPVVSNAASVAASSASMKPQSYAAQAQMPVQAQASQSQPQPQRQPQPQPQPMPLTVDVSTQPSGLAPTPIPATAAVPIAAPASSDIDSGITVWDLRQSDGSVRNALARWAKDAGWQFIWAVPTDFSIDATATIHGTFEQALHSVVDALSHSDVPIQALMYKGNHVLRITAKGAS
ncbi:toxin co-regulated pilus biosynthesis Q family protein [Paraburkholderia sp.]|uniref:toxin co-regulated pilus biosynthesis Q family protein n=1 Tax=Paraburkholderia sp. TaxID=1926495 RepID=UPI003D6E09A6